jgi:DNA-binding transcriptional LysR family regulator
MDKLGGLMIFVKAADLGSFVAAGRALEMTASAVGKSVARLEQELGVRLLQRTTRRVQLTDEGRLFHERCKQILQDLQDAQAMVSSAKAAPSGRLRISAPIVGHHFLIPLLPGFLERYPEIEVDVVFSDRSLDLIDEGIDLAIRSGELSDSNLISRPLQNFRLLLCASPTYLKRCGTPQDPCDLAQHAAIRFRHPNSGKLLDWPMRSEVTEAMSQPRTVLVCNNIEAVLSASLLGLGIACMPDFLVGDALAEGRLVSLLEGHLSGGGQFNALWPSNRHLSPKVRVFIDHLGEQLAR